MAMLLAATAVLMTTLSLETQFHRVRARVLAADPAQLERLGRHLVVGYRDVAEIEGLLERRAIAGVFVGSRNVEGLSVDAIRRQIASWQDVRRRQGLPTLLVATDQEGGAISRVSPPLPRQPSIASVIAPLAEESARKAAARDYGLTQGRALASLGINLNFAPVVDLDKNLVNPNDRYTRSASARSRPTRSPSRWSRGSIAWAFETPAYAARSSISRVSDRSMRTRTSKPVTCGFRSISSSAAIGSRSVRSWATAPLPC
jgi:beta-N-acetylhexosaminidase